MLDNERNKAFRTDIQRNISKAVDAKKYDWSILRVDEAGKITQE